MEKQSPKENVEVAHAALRGSVRAPGGFLREPSQEPTIKKKY